MDPGSSGQASAAANRRAILAAARWKFGQAGFRGTTLRSVARDAGVDPHLVRHHFHDKADLFRAAVRIENGCPAAPEPDSGTGWEGAGMHLAQQFFRLVEANPVEVRALVAGAMSHSVAAEVLRMYMIGSWLRPAVSALGADQPDLRAALVAGHLLGVAMLYYLAPAPPLSGLPASKLAEAIAPELQRLLEREL
jgi:AcrR family transcriptional regulator